MSPGLLATPVSLSRGRMSIPSPGRGIEVTIGDLTPYEIEPTEDVIFLRDYVLDKKVIDLEENEVEVVYDIRLVLRNKKLYVTDVDTGKPHVSGGWASGYLRRSSIITPIPKQSR